MANFSLTTRSQCRSRKTQSVKESMSRVQFINIHSSLILSHGYTTRVRVCNLTNTGSVSFGPSEHTAILSPQRSPVFDGYCRNNLSGFVGDDFRALKLRYDHLEMIKKSDESRRAHNN